MLYEKSVWSWVTPGMFAGFAMVGTIYAEQAWGFQMWLALPLLLMVLCAAVAMANFSEFVAERNLAAMERRQAMLAETGDTQLMREARMLATQSPELAAEMARRIGRPDLILFPSRQGRQAQIKLAGTDVTLQFALHLLERSSNDSMEAQRNYSDKTHNWDPNHEVYDRQQWMQLNWLWARDGICTRYVPNQDTNRPPLWLPPWTPERIMALWLLPDELRHVLKVYLVDGAEGQGEED